MPGVPRSGVCLNTQRTAKIKMGEPGAGPVLWARKRAILQGSPSLAERLYFSKSL